MPKHIIPACYSPTTVVVVDDTRQYLDNLSLSLDEKKFVPKFFSNPREALRFLQEYRSNSIDKRYLHHSLETELEQGSIEVNIPMIREEVYDLHRFSQISIIVVDYAMPDLNGLDLCRQLKYKPFKKILLTGEADEKIAVHAFNDGIIDKFIRKDSPNFHSLINSTIDELQRQYFQELSSTIIDSLITNTDSFLSWSDDPAFIKLFNQIFQENDFTEYYLADSYGSFLFLDFNGNPSWLAVRDEQGMQAVYEIAEGSDKPFPDKMLADIKNREKILFLPEDKGISEDPEEYAKSLHVAKTLIGSNNNTYYYSFIKNSIEYGIQRDKVISYKEYLEKLK